MQTTTRRLRRSGAAALLATAILGLSACGGSGEDDKTESAASGSAASGSPTRDAKWAAAQDKWDLEMARCLRKQGIQIEDPKPGEGFPDFERPANFPEISQSCQAEVGEPPSLIKDPEVRKQAEKEAEESGLKVARCLRDKGYDVKDPTDGALRMPEDLKDADWNACEEAMSGE